jgi:hypothetical protein
MGLLRWRCLRWADGHVSVSKRVDLPNQPKTPLRSLRVADDLWLVALAKAQREGVTLTAVITAALRTYAEDAADS